MVWSTRGGNLRKRSADVAKEFPCAVVSNEKMHFADPTVDRDLFA
jgi:hypothetical protein